MDKTEVSKDKNIKLISMHDEMSSSYLSYAMSVIVSRALPDVRDGLKPVHRRILYAMYKGGYDWSKQFRKSARIVGDVIGKYHPHGDQSVYDALVRMVQDFSMSLPLVDGQGNFGSIDGDPAAAMRYTETRLSKVSQFLIEDIEKNTVDYKSNYDETEKEPTVLPAQYPNLLVNGAGGIAVGMATSIPPHNLGEIIDGTLALIENKDIKIKELMKHIPGPDFPTGGVIIGKDIINQGYNKGRGSFKIRGEISIETQKNGRERLIINSIPYQVNKSILNERIAQLVREKKIEGIKDIRDESNREGIRVSIDLRNGVEPETIKRQLYKNTQIESSFGFNTLAIVDGKPKTCNLKEFLENFLTFREDVVIKKTKFDLKKAEERAHILIGLSVSVENLDKIIKIIRNSKTPDDAKKSILSTKWKINKSQKMISLVEGKKTKSDYSLSEPQVIAILELRLQKLTALGINEIEVEIKKLAELIAKYKKIISSKKELLKVISEELKNIKEKFSVPRRTKIIDAVLNYDIEETIQKQAVLITVTLQGYIKRGSLNNVKTQKRGGKGKTGITTRNEDSVVQTLSVDTHTSVLFFSTEGLVYRIKAWKIPEGSSSSKGKSLFNILPLKNHQSISSIMPFPEGDENLNDYQIIFATAKGKVRKNSLDDFSSINASGKIAMKLDNNDKIVGVKICKDDQDAILSTKFGKCIRFETKKLRIFKGRSSKGIKGIELAPNDEIVSLSVINNDKTSKNGKKSKDDKAEIKAGEGYILSITENGYGKKTSHYDYRVTNRGGKGIIGIINSPRNGNISSSFPVYEGDEIMISTNKGRVIRVAVKEIRTAGRNTQGVRIIKLTGDEKVVSAIKIEDNLI
ncbi:DNA gyrase subunit A [Candidatus Pelagibacter sp. HIMB1321]|uniref:DNA gyrase subunit A n=1 Tax=Candidatus Pelagibacter sp. HIMB1321 TaxID=1388755 RepID=UPI000A07EB0C|nr:DNA gyrase subunit A [Candidatus Pelagibacter sp. HIMB1321]SMF75331.1 DNA gyrase subunit A [Candidatus Pelagibacter sp. HIMB1321]